MTTSVHAASDDNSDKSADNEVLLHTFWAWAIGEDAGSLIRVIDSKPENIHSRGHLLEAAMPGAGRNECAADCLWRYGHKNLLEAKAGSAHSPLFPV